ncbi:MAG: hypothetical protein ACEPOZ_20680 [Marinifilaceae bacterium]
MITVKEQMIVTEYIYRALVNYGNIILEKLLRQAINLKAEEVEDGRIKYSVRNIFEFINSQNGIVNGGECQEMGALIIQFLKELSAPDFTALSFHLINEEKYHNLLLDQLDEKEEDSQEQFDAKIGRKMAELLYDPKKEMLESWLSDYLFDRIVSFASKFDLSLIDEETVSNLEHVLESYTNPTF